MKHYKRSGLAIFLGTFILTVAHANDISNEQIDTLVKQESLEAAKHWNITPLFQITDDKKIEMSPSGTLRFGRDGMRAILNNANESNHKVIVKWIAGHETWHQVQRRDGNTVPPENLTGNRQLECEADVMASHYLAESVMVGQFGPELTQKARLLAASISNIVDVLQQLELGFGGNAAHPSGRQRRYGIALGLMRGLLPLIENIPEFEMRLAARAQIQNVIDFRDGESTADWLPRICQLNLNDGKNVDALGELKPSIIFNKNGKPPIVEFSLPYKNVSSEFINVSMQVRTIAVPKQSPENVDAWQSVDAMSYEFDLSPGQEFTVSGTLLWTASNEVFPRLLIPKAPGALYSVKTLDTVPVPASTHQGFPRTQRQERLAGILQMLFNSSSGNFESVKKTPCRLESGDMSCEVNANVPGSLTSEITYEGNGGRYIDIVLYSGQEGAHASRIFREFKRDIEIIYNTTLNERTTSSGGRSLSFKPVSNIKFELLQFGKERIKVIARILPALF